MGPTISTELSRLHRRDLLSQAEYERLAAAASAQPARKPPEPPASDAPQTLASSAPPTWFDELLQRYDRRLNAFVNGMLGNALQADDVVQEVFVAAWRAARQQKAPFGATVDEDGARRWLFRVAYRRAISLRRHSRVLVWESLDAIEEGEEGQEGRVPGAALAASRSSFEDRVIERVALAAALARLSDADATCVLLSVAHGVTVIELAQSLKITPEAAKQRVKRAKARLRVAYFAHDDAGPLVHGSAHVSDS